MGKAIGIDLGTTNSCAAIVENGKARVITYKGGHSTIPSVFALDEKGNPLIGHDAKNQASLNPQNTVAAAKRLIGRNFHSKQIEKIKQVFTYELVEGESSEVLVKVRGQVFTLEQISAAILRKIKEVAEDSLGAEVDQAVITVPAYFNDRQRQAVRTAGKLAGLKVLRVLNEPTAAALAYGMGRNLSQRIAVYDLGGGTFDISIIDIKGRVFEVIATGGDTFLGGVDFDDRVMQWVLEQFFKQTSIDLSYDRSAIQRIRDASETSKIELSSVLRTRITVKYITQGDNGPIDLDIEFTRERLEELTHDLVERTVMNVDRIMREAGSTREQIDEVLLVGGQSRMPLVQRRLTEYMGKPPCKGVNPDEAVGIGAAIMAHSLASTSQKDDVTLLDVLPMPIGISKPDGSMQVLFPKNQPLPDYKKCTLTTSKDNQKSILLRIYQGDSSQCAENELLGTFVFSGIRPGERGSVRIEVSLHIDSEGILKLTAKDRKTGQTVESTLKIGTAREAAAPKAEAPSPAAPPPLKLGSGGMFGGNLDAEAEEPPTTIGTGEPSGKHAKVEERGTEVGPRGRDYTEGIAETGTTSSKPTVAASPPPPPVASTPPHAPPPVAPTTPATSTAMKPVSLWDRVRGWFSGLFGGK